MLPRGVLLSALCGAALAATKDTCTEMVHGYRCMSSNPQTVVLKPGGDCRTECAALPDEACCESEGNSTCTSHKIVGPHTIYQVKNNGSMFAAGVCAQVTVTCVATDTNPPKHGSAMNRAIVDVVNLEPVGNTTCLDACKELEATGMCSQAKERGECTFFSPLPGETYDQMIAKLETSPKGDDHILSKCTAVGDPLDVLASSLCVSPSPDLVRIRFETSPRFCPAFVPGTRVLLHASSPRHNCTDAQIETNTCEVPQKNLRVFRKITHGQVADAASVMMHATDVGTLAQNGFDISRSHVLNCLGTFKCTPPVCRFLDISYFSDPTNPYTREDEMPLSAGSRNFVLSDKTIDAVGYSQCNPAFGTEVDLDKGDTNDYDVAVGPTDEALAYFDHNLLSSLGDGPPLWPDVLPLPPIGTPPAGSPKNPPYMYAGDMAQYSRYREDPGNEEPPRPGAYTCASATQPPPIIWLKPTDGGYTMTFDKTDAFNAMVDAGLKNAAQAGGEYSYASPRPATGSYPKFDPANVACAGGEGGVVDGQVTLMTTCWRDRAGMAHGHFGVKSTDYSHSFAIVAGYPQMPRNNTDNPTIASMAGAFSSKMQALGVVLPPQLAADFNDAETNEKNYNITRALFLELNENIAFIQIGEWPRAFNTQSTCQVFSDHAEQQGGCSWLPLPTPAGFCPTQLAENLDDATIPAHQAQSTREGGQYGLFDFTNDMFEGNKTYVCTDFYVARLNRHSLVRPPHELACETAHANVGGVRVNNDQTQGGSSWTAPAPGESNYAAVTADIMFRYAPFATDYPDDLRYAQLGTVSIPYGIPTTWAGGREVHVPTDASPQPEHLTNTDVLAMTYAVNGPKSQQPQNTAPTSTVGDVVEWLRCGGLDGGVPGKSAFCSYLTAEPDDDSDLGHLARRNYAYMACPRHQCTNVRDDYTPLTSTSSFMVRDANDANEGNIINATFDAAFGGPTRGLPRAFKQSLKQGGSACQCCSHGDLWNTEVGVSAGAYYRVGRTDGCVCDQELAPCEDAGNLCSLDNCGDDDFRALCPRTCGVCPKTPPTCTLDCAIIVQAKPDGYMAGGVSTPALAEKSQINGSFFSTVTKGVATGVVIPGDPGDVCTGKQKPVNVRLSIPGNSPARTDDAWDGRWMNAAKENPIFNLCGVDGTIGLQEAVNKFWYSRMSPTDARFWSDQRPLATYCAGADFEKHTITPTGGFVMTDIFYDDDGESDSAVSGYARQMHRDEAYNMAKAHAPITMDASARWFDGTTSPPLTTDNNVRAMWHSAPQMGFPTTGIHPGDHHTPDPLPTSSNGLGVTIGSYQRTGHTIDTGNGFQGHPLVGSFSAPWQDEDGAEPVVPCDPNCYVQKSNGNFPAAEVYCGGRQDKRQRPEFMAVSAECPIESTDYGPFRYKYPTPTRDPATFGVANALMPEGFGKFQWFAGHASSHAWNRDQLVGAIVTNMQVDTPIVLRSQDMTVVNGYNPPSMRAWSAVMHTNGDCGAAGAGVPQYSCQLITYDMAAGSGSKGGLNEVLASGAYPKNRDGSVVEAYKRADMVRCGFVWPGSTQYGLPLGQTTIPIPIIARNVFKGDVATRLQMDTLFGTGTVGASARRTALATLAFTRVAAGDQRATLPGTCTRWPFGHAHPDAFPAGEYETLASKFSKVNDNNVRVFALGTLHRYCEKVAMSPDGTRKGNTAKGYVYVHNDPLEPAAREAACAVPNAAGMSRMESVTGGIILPERRFSDMCSATHRVCLFVPGFAAARTLRAFFDRAYDFTGFTVFVLPFSSDAFASSFVRAVVSQSVDLLDADTASEAVGAKSDMFDLLLNIEDKLAEPEPQSPEDTVKRIASAYYTKRCPNTTHCHASAGGRDNDHVVLKRYAAPPLNDTGVVIRHAGVTLVSAVDTHPITFEGANAGVPGNGARIYVGAKSFTLGDTTDTRETCGGGGSGCAVVVFSGDDVSGSTVLVTAAATAVFVLGASTHAFQTTHTRTLIAEDLQIHVKYGGNCPKYVAGVAGVNGSVAITTDCKSPVVLYEPYTHTLTRRVSAANITGEGLTQVNVAGLMLEFSKVQEDRVYHRTVELSWVYYVVSGVTGVMCAGLLLAHYAMTFHKAHTLRSIIARLGMSFAAPIAGKGWATRHTTHGVVVDVAHGQAGTSGGANKVAHPGTSNGVTYTDYAVLAMVLGGVDGGCRALPRSLVVYALRRSRA